MLLKNKTQLNAAIVSIRKHNNAAWVDINNVVHTAISNPASYAGYIADLFQIFDGEKCLISEKIKNQVKLVARYWIPNGFKLESGNWMLDSKRKGFEAPKEDVPESPLDWKPAGFDDKAKARKESAEKTRKDKAEKAEKELKDLREKAAQVDSYKAQAEKFGTPDKLKKAIEDANKAKEKADKRVESATREALMHKQQQEKDNLTINRLLNENKSMGSTIASLQKVIVEKDKLIAELQAQLAEKLAA